MEKPLELFETSSESGKKGHAPWTDEELEHLNRCPACASTKRQLAYDQLTDDVCAGNPGTWNMWACEECQVLYLDPRPSPAHIGKAYSTYYTHTAPAESRGASSRPLNWVYRIRTKLNLRRRIANDFINSALGHKLQPTLPLARWLRPLISDRLTRELWDIRHLPAPFHENSKLLDVGCGNGEFLQVAGKLGYIATGLEPDPLAASVARQNGNSVIEEPLIGNSFADQTFDYITLSHVIEHFHSPVHVMNELRRLIRPGGCVWITTPNADSLGREIFGRFWRGIECPRHLVLFTAKQITHLLSDAGFREIRVLPTQDESRSYFKRSLALARDAKKEPQFVYRKAELELNWNATWDTLAEQTDETVKKHPGTGESFLVTAKCPT